MPCAFLCHHTAAGLANSDSLHHSFVKVLYGARASEVIQSTEKNNDLLVFEQQARSRAHRRYSGVLTS